MKRRVTTRPSTHCLTVDEVKDQLIIEDTEDDAYLITLIEQATDFAEKYTNRPIMAQTITYYFDDTSGTLKLYTENITTVHPNYTDVDGLEVPLMAKHYSADIFTYPAVVKIKEIPSTVNTAPNSVHVAVIAGYTDAADVPAGIKAGIMLMVGHLYLNREGSNDKKVHTVPMGIESFLDQYRVYG